MSNKTNSVINSTTNELDKYGADSKKVVKKTKKILKKALLELKEEAMNGCIKNKRLGICGNLNSKTDKYEHFNAYKFVEENCSDWEYFSGAKSHPVPNDINYLRITLNRWDTPEKVNYRLSLIEHLLTKVS